MRKGDSLDEVRDTMLDVAEKAGDKPFTEEEVNRAGSSCSSARTGGRRHQPDRRPAQRVGLAGRLAAVLATATGSKR